MTNDKLNLTTTQAIGVALSGVLKNCTMSTCQDIAKDFETHLHRIGFSLVNSPECIRPESIEENHAALTAQQSDVPRYDPRLGLIQKEPVNQELVEALKEAVRLWDEHKATHEYHITSWKQALAKAEGGKNE